MTSIALWLAIMGTCLMSCRPTIVRAGFSDAGDFTPVGGVSVYPFEPVRQILAQHCTICHGPETKSGGVDLSTYKKVMKRVVKRHPEKSMLYLVLVTGAMPIPHYYSRLPKEDIEIIKDWISHNARQK